MSELSAKVKQASELAANGSIGGNNSKVNEILESLTLPKDDIASFTYLVEGPNLTASLNLSRSFVPYHIHVHHDELLYVLRGKGDFRIGRDIFNFEPGNVLYVPMNTIHGAKIDSDLKPLSAYTPRFDIRNPDRVFVNEEGTPIEASRAASSSQ